jgi:tRNA (guanine10-N2)-dimethyltransferase
MYLSLLSQEHPDIALYELLSLGKITLFQQQEHFVLFKKKFNFSRLTFTKNIFQVIQSIPHDSLRETVSSLNLKPYYHGSYAARILHAKDAPSLLTEQEFGSLLWQTFPRPVVDLDHPKTQFTLIITKKTAFLTTLIWTNQERFEQRKMHNLPEPHPTGMHPRLARGLINLLGASSFLDPFCGAGGILIEGKLLGLKVTGSDIDPIMIRRAEKNLAHYGLKAALSVRDATTLKKRCAGIVTDLPYGKNSIISKGLYRAFFLHAEHLTKRMVVALPSTTRTNPLIKGTGWKIDKKFTVYIHKTLSKRILILSQQSFDIS